MSIAHSFKTLAMTAMSVIATVCVIDLVLQRLKPIEHKLEAADGIAQLLKSDPETLVLGSSYSRTFNVLGQLLAERTGRETPLVAIPLEAGKLTSYDWLIENRLRAIVDRLDDSGQPRYRNLRRFILLTEWWDSCRFEGEKHWNLPSLAWGLEHYAADVGAQGMKAYNRNYTQYQLRQWIWFSALVRDRTDPSIADTLSRAIRKRPLGRTQAEYDEAMKAWQLKTERGVACLGDRAEMAALDRIIDFAVERNLEVTVILFPMMPETMTEKARATTLTRAREMYEARLSPRGIRVIDYTWQTPLTDADFMADFDHVNATGNLKLSRWALDRDLSFLLKPAELRPASSNQSAGLLQ